MVPTPLVLSRRQATRHSGHRTTITLIWIQGSVAGKALSQVSPLIPTDSHSVEEIVSDVVPSIWRRQCGDACRIESNVRTHAGARNQGCRSLRAWCASRRRFSWTYFERLADGAPAP